MSTHCNKYPLCGCPSDVGYCGLDEATIKRLIEAEAREASKPKTGANGGPNRAQRRANLKKKNRHR